MGMREKYIDAISAEEGKPPRKEVQDKAMIEDMEFALEFLKFSGRSDASPQEILAVAKVAEFYRKYAAEKKE